VLTPKTSPVFSIDHLHQPTVSVAEQASKIVEQLRRTSRMTFRGLTADAENTLVVIARFLALLELYKEGVIRFEQMISLGELQITWVGTAQGEVSVSDEFDIPVQTIDETDNV
jgi:segregation and condensation protein A